VVIGRAKQHHYEVRVRWTGNTGEGTGSYRGYERSHDVAADGKPTIPGSADPGFRGDPARWNPEELLVASLSQCQMLSYLAVAAASEVVVVDYADTATAEMVTHPDGSGEFTSATLRPAVTVASPDMVETARGLHDRASELCFVARSLDFPVHHEPTVRAAG